MPTKPSDYEINASKVFAKDPDFARHAMEAVINETPELRDALLARGLVEEVTD